MSRTVSCRAKGSVSRVAAHRASEYDRLEGGVGQYRGYSQDYGSFRVATGSTNLCLLYYSRGRGRGYPNDLDEGIYYETSGSSRASRIKGRANYGGYYGG